MKQPGASTPPRGPVGRQDSRRGLTALLGALVTGLFLWLAFHEIQPRSLVESASGWPLAPILLSLLLQCLAFALRLIRWGLATRHLGQIEWKTLLSIGSMGLSAVFLLPVRLGELVRPALVAEESEIGLGEASAPVILERLVDGWIMSAVMFATLLALGEQAGNHALTAGAYPFAALFVLASAFLAIGTNWRLRISSLVGSLFRRLSSRLGTWVAGLALGFFEALRDLSARPLLLPYVLLSLALWLAEAGSIYALFGVLEHRPPWLAAPTVLCVLVVGTVLPSGPIHLGVFEYAVIFGLGIFRQDHAAAAAYGLLLHSLETATVLGFGLAGTWAGGLRLHRLLRIVNHGPFGRRRSTALQLVSGEATRTNPERRP